MSFAADSIYRDMIVDLGKHPEHYGEISPYDAEVHHVNPTCGDTVTLRVRVVDGQIADLGWTGDGCSISRASTSVMSDLVLGHSVAEALELQQTFLKLMQSQGRDVLSEDEMAALDEAMMFQGTARLSMRVKCALLGWMAMKSAVAEAVGKPASTQDEKRSDS